MGLDAVEIVMAVEEAFDIRIDDAEASQLLTPRLLIDYVYSKVEKVAATVCLTQRAFNLLRKALIQQGTWRRSEIKPNTKLAELFPQKQRAAIMSQVSKELKIKGSPKLVLPSWVEWSLIGASLSIGGLFTFNTFQNLQSAAVFLGLIVTILAAGLGLKITKPLRNEFPKELQTLGDYARWVMTHKSDLAKVDVPAWTREQVAVRVREIIVEHLGCKPDFSEDAQFVEDLGLS